MAQGRQNVLEEGKLGGCYTCNLGETYFEGFALTNVCAEGDLIGPEVWGKERARRERD